MDKDEVLQIFEKVKAVITNSHVVYASGRHGSAYVNKDAIYPHTKETSQLCRVIAEQFIGCCVEVVAGPAVGGVLLSQWIANYLSEITGREVLSTYLEHDEEVLAQCKGNDKPLCIKLPWHDPKDATDELVLIKGQKLVVVKSNFVAKRGYDKLLAGKNVLVVEDVLTTGELVREVVEAVSYLGGNVVGLGALCNRGSVTSQDVAGVPRLFTLVDVELESFEESECTLCKEGVPINTEVGKGKEYLARRNAS